MVELVISGATLLKNVQVGALMVNSSNEPPKKGQTSSRCPQNKNKIPYKQDIDSKANKENADATIIGVNGHGACDYKRWLDAEEIASGIVHLTCVDVCPISSALVEECDVRSGVGHMDTSSKDIYYNLNTSPTTSGQVKRRKVILEDLIREDEVVDESSRRHCKRLRCGELKVEMMNVILEIRISELSFFGLRCWCYGWFRFYFWHCDWV